jgi:Crp-like helix-turn-helix protein
MVGSKREAVTKAFTLLQRAGVVDLKHRRIYVRDIEALKRATHGEPLPTSVS